MASISFTKEEINALWHAAGNMSDDFKDYFSFMPDVNKYHKSFQSAMNKLKRHIEQVKPLTPKEEQEFNFQNENSDEALRR